MKRLTKAIKEKHKKRKLRKDFKEYNDAIERCAKATRGLGAAITEAGVATTKTLNSISNFTALAQIAIIASEDIEQMKGTHRSDETGT